MSNVKVGDLAIIRPPYLDRPMLGLPVTVVRAALIDELIVAKNGDESRNFGGPGLSWVCDGASGYLPSVIADACLRPIRGDSITDSEVRDLYEPKPIKEVA